MKIEYYDKAMGEKNELNAVVEMLTQWVTAVKLRNALNYTDINRTAEDLALRLLNAAYDYNLKNLNWELPNYPAVDLGDQNKGIAFQVTASVDLNKIKKTLKKFYAPDGPHREFPKSIYFFFIKERIPALTIKTKEELKRIAPDFDPDKHMLSMRELLMLMEQFYSTDRMRFKQIKSLLEVEWGYEAPKPLPINVFFQKTINELEERLNEKYSESKGPNSWQKWFYKNYWLFGIHYHKPIEKQKIGFSNIPDYLFPTIDGFLDILEIKLPNAPVIFKDRSHPGSYKWSSKASEAIGQVVHYLNEIQEHRLEIQQRVQRNYREEYNIDISLVNPRAFILIGNKDGWSEDKIEAIRKLNASLHRIEVLTYTDILLRGYNIIEVISRISEE